MGTKIYRYNELGADVRVRCALRSAGQVTAAGGTITGTPDFHPQDGVIVGAGGGLNFAPASHADLNNGGQIVGYYQMDAIADDTDTITGGVGVGANEYLWYYGNAGDTIRGRCRRSTSGQFICEHGVGDDTGQEPPSIHGKPTLARINMVWDASNMRLYLNGNFLTQRTRTVSNADLFESLWIGSEEGSANQFDGRIKNFQLAADAVSFTVPSELTGVAVWGDSFAANVAYHDGTASNSPAFDGAAARGIEGYLNLVHELGITWTGATDDGYGVGGAGIDDGATPAIEDNRAAMLADNPVGVIMLAGANNISGANPVLDASFNADLLDHYTTVMDHASVDWMIHVLPSMGYGDNDLLTAAAYASWKAVIKQCQDVLRTWEAANPAKKGRLLLLDAHGVHGGHAQRKSTQFTGNIAGHGSTDDNRHPSPSGNERLADYLGPLVYQLAVKQRPYGGGPVNVAQIAGIGADRVAKWRTR